MKSIDDLPWPPIITAAKVPWYVHARDWILTLFAWAVLLAMLGRGLVFFIDYFSDPASQTTHRPLFVRYTAPEWKSLWEHFFITLYASAFMVLWIVVWTFRRLKQVQRTCDSRPTHDLSLEEHAGSLGLDPERVSEWRKLKVATVRFKGEDLRQIADVESGDTLEKKA
jgi:poly-beta-1,6-N-acetyl-D-glucosamine biosynthesis protein PgaD